MESGSSNPGVEREPAAFTNRPASAQSVATGNHSQPLDAAAADRRREALDRQYWRSWERHGRAYYDFIESIQDPLVDEEELVDDAVVPVIFGAELPPPPLDDFIGLSPAPYMSLGWLDNDRAVPPRLGRTWLDDADDEFNPDHLDPDRMRRWRNNVRGYQADIEEFDVIITEQEQQIRHLEEAINLVVQESCQIVPE
jgi:hypothetical protein